MKLGAITFFDGSRIPIPEGIAVSLGLSEDAKLSIWYLTEPTLGPSYPVVELIVSSIPFDFWSEAYECSIPLIHLPGTSARAAKAIADMDGNILQSDSTAVGLMQRGFWTVIVEFSSRETGAPTEDEFRKELMKINKEGKFLAEDIDVEKHINMRKLFLLAECCHKIERQPEFKFYGRFRGSVIELDEDNKILDKLISHTDLFEADGLKYVFLSVDTEERMLTVCFPRWGRMLYHIDLIVDWQHERVSPKGLFSKIASFLAYKDFNILRSYNYILEKKGNTEKASVHFIVEGLPYNDNELKEIGRKLKNLTHKVDDQDLTFVNDVKAIPITGTIDSLKDEPLIVVPMKNEMPKCFVARLSFKKGEPLTEKVRDIIKGNGIKPIEAEPSAYGMGEQVTQAVMDTIWQSCCMVMIIEKHERFVYKQKDKPYEYTESPWLVAEDAIAHTLGIQVFRLKDKDVTRLTFNRDADYIEFDDTNDESMNIALTMLDKYIKRWKRTQDYMRQVSAATRRSIALGTPKRRIIEYCWH